jgi:hypothetical protein
MARKTNEEIKEMSLNDIEYYAQDRPAEGARIAKICGRTAALGLDMYMQYQVERAKKYATPKKFQTE